MVPVMGTPDEVDQVVDCLGPGGQTYTVSIKEWDVEPPEGTFTSRLLRNLESIVVE